MSLHKFIAPAFVAALVFGCHNLSMAQTESTAPQADMPLMTQSTVLAGEIVGTEQIKRAFMSFGTNEFMFIVPDAVLARFSQERPAMLTGRQADFSISFRLLNKLPAGATVKNELKAWVQTHYTDSVRIEDFAIPVADHEGVGLQFHQRPRSASASNRFVRIIWTPCEAGVLEFLLVSEANCVKAAQQNFDVVLTTFCTNEQGKIKVIPRLGRS